MTTYRTGNPIGSTDPRDLYDNAENLDEAMNKQGSSWTDRLGRTRKTFQAAENAADAAEAAADQAINTEIPAIVDNVDSQAQQYFETAESYRSSQYIFAEDARNFQTNEFIANHGNYVPVGDYAAGIEISQYNEVVRDASGEFWRLSGSRELPYTTTGSGLPEGGAFVPVGDAALRQQLALDNGYRLVANQMAPNAYGIPGPLTYVVEQNVTIRPVGYFDDKLWGRDSSNRIHSSDDMGATWTSRSSVVNRNFVKLLKCADGEVLAQNTAGISKSSGWSGNPATATWSTVLMRPTGNVADFLKWGFDGDGQKFIATHYSSTRTDSRYVWISTDAGSTWSIVWDSNTVDPANNSHLHAACYDPWAGRFYFTEGHSTLAGIYYSDDDGANWTKAVDDINGVQRQPEFTTMKATDFGIVCGTDGHPNGIWLIRRTDDPDTLPIEYLGAWSKQREGVLGFADDSFRDPDTGIVYVGFGNAGSVFSDIPNVIYAVGSSGANIVYSGLSGRYFSVIAAKGILWAQQGVGTTWVRGKTSRFGGNLNDSVRALDRGNLGLGEGEYTINNSIRIGSGAKALGLNGMSIGENAISTSQLQTVIGRSAVGGGGQRSTVVGDSAQGNVDSVAIGANAKTDPFGVAVGFNSETTAAYGTAVGIGAKAGAGIAIGRNANHGESTATNAIAIGAAAMSSNGIAIGGGSEVSAPAISGIAAGTNSKAIGNYAAAYGYGAEATAASSVAMGYNASVTAFNGIAIGSGATATHERSVAIGSGSSTSRYGVVSIGNRDLESTLSGGAIYLRSGNGSRYRIHVSNAGELLVTPEA